MGITDVVKFADAAAALREADVVAFARAEIACLRNNPVDGVRVLDQGDNRRYSRQIMKALALAHPLHLMEIADYARAGWTLADEALRELIVEFLDRGESMPTYLAAYNMELARGNIRHPPGPRKEDRFLRDLALVVVMEIVAGRFGLNPTRSSSRRPSAASVVAKAAQMSESAVVTLWRRYGERECVAYHRRRPL
jgi:hypothetical protein